MIQIKRGATTVASVLPLSSSNMTKAVMGEEQITLVWEAPAFVPLMINDYIVYEGAQWMLNKLPTVKKLSANLWQYNAVFQSTKYDLAKAMFLLFDNTTTLPSGEFSLTGTADTFITLLVDNLNRIAGSTIWSVGDVVEDTDYKTLTFSNEDCLTVLARLAEEFDTEYHISNRIVHLTRISTNREITLEYGSTLYDIERASVDSSDLVTRLYAYGSKTNLASDYRGGNSPLRLPDAVGDYLEANVANYGIIEHSRTFDDIYPRLSSGGAGTVTGVGNEFTFSDAALDFDINSYKLDGTPAKVHFNTGQCAGYDFDIRSYNHSAKTFVIIANTQENDFTLPTADLKPATGDKYVLIDIIMPPAYLSAAEAELQAKAQEWLNENSVPAVNYRAKFSELYAKQNLQNVECGDLVGVFDADLDIDTYIRIVKLQKGIADFWNVQFDLSNTVTATRIERIEGNVASVQNTVVVANERINRNNLRAYQNNRELQEMVFDPDGYFDPVKIKPLSIETTMLSVTAKSQSFQLSTLLQPNYAGNPQVLQWGAGLLTHFTIVDNAIKEWTIAQGSITITGSNQTAPLYIYVLCAKAGTEGSIYLSTAALKFDSHSVYWVFLIGVLHTPVNSVRGISLTYGQTTINGQFIKTGVISSIDGATYFNLNTGEIAGNIKFRAADNTLKTVDQAIGEIQIGGRNIALNSGISVSNASYNIKNYDLSSDLIAGEIYTATIWGSLYSGKTHFGAWMGGGYTWVGWFVEKSIGVYQMTFTAPITVLGSGVRSILNIYTVDWWVDGMSTISKFQLELGNKATDWTPAPEDIQAQIDASNALLADIASDNKLTPNEKHLLKKEWDDIYNEYPILVAQGDDIVNNTDNYSDAYSYLETYVTPLLANLTVTSDITGSTFRQKFRDYYARREELKDDIQRAVDSQSRAADYIRTAIQNGSTEISGGLALVNLLFQKSISGLVNGGLSGLEGDNILNWGGSTYEEALEDVSRALGAAMKSSFMNKEDGSGHLAKGKIFWDILGALNVGNFSILNGNIIGRDTSGAEKIRLSTENVPAIASLTSSYAYVATDIQTANQCDLEVLWDSNIDDYYIQINAGSLSASATVGIVIPYATNLVVENATLNSSVNGGAVNVTGVSQSVVVKNSGGTTIATGATGSSLALPSAGTYTVIISSQLLVENNGFEQASEVSFTTHNNIKYTENVKKTAIGLDGLYSYFSDSEYWYFKSGVGLKYKGDMDIPGVLFSGSVVSGIFSNTWGAKKSTGSITNSTAGTYVVPVANMSSSAYVVQITPQTAGYRAAITGKTSSNFTVMITNSSGTAANSNFDFVVTGIN